MFCLLNKIPRRLSGWISVIKKKKNKSLNTAPWQFSKVMRFHFKVRWISCLALFVQINYNGLALTWEWKKLLENGCKPVGSWSHSMQNRMTCIVSYLMFKVNSEVRFKWLLFHFLCKPKIINKILKSNTQQINNECMCKYTW